MAPLAERLDMGAAGNSGRKPFRTVGAHSFRRSREKKGFFTRGNPRVNLIYTFNYTKWVFRIIRILPTTYQLQPTTYQLQTEELS